MCCMCQIVPERVLKRLAADRKFSARAKEEFRRHNQDRHAIATAADPGGQVNPRCRADGRSTHSRARAGHHRVRL